MGIAAGHLLTASVLSAPASLLIAKVMFPERETPQDYRATSLFKLDTVNGIDALCRGASEGTALAINVLGMLIAFVAFVACINFLFSAVQGWVGISSPITMQNLLGYLNAPFAWLMGVPSKDCNLIGQILGERIVLNEFIGYIDLLSKKDQLSERSMILATYALCGFANFASIAIQIGGIGAIAPERRGDLARLGVKSMIGGLLASYITASIAGILL
jgi:CNT family concentrative nucleoside transporter